MAVHHEFRKGQRVHIIFIDGSTTVGKFVQNSSKFLIVDDGQQILKFKWHKLRSVNINRLK